jgi:hypothetical protein
VQVLGNRRQMPIASRTIESAASLCTVRVAHIADVLPHNTPETRGILWGGCRFAVRICRLGCGAPDPLELLVLLISIGKQIGPIGRVARLIQVGAVHFRFSCSSTIVFDCYQAPQGLSSLTRSKTKMVGVALMSCELRSPAFGKELTRMTGGSTDK